jgi:ABC-2 type transport system ATP-binding protein
MDTITVAPGHRRDPAADADARLNLLEISGLVKRYRKTVAVNGLNLAIREGEIFGLLGPNGAGKTTTVSIVTTLLRPDGGSVRVGGFDVQREGTQARRLMGSVPQDIGLYQTLNARQNLEYFGGLYGLRGRELKQRIDELLEVTELTRFARKPNVAKFSGGMRRRLNIAAGILHKPRLLILDEPTAGVDPQSRAHIHEHIRRLNREDKVTVVYTTHYMEEAEALCDRVAIIDHGEVIACDSVPGLLASMAGTVFQMTLAEPFSDLTEILERRPGITEVNQHGELHYQVVSVDQARGLEALLGIVGEFGLQLRALDVSTPNLEQVFLKLTGRGLRDD